MNSTINENNQSLGNELYENKLPLQPKYDGPTATPSLVDGKYKDLNTNYTMSGDYAYVIDSDGNLKMVQVSKLENIGGGHTSLTGGAPVKYAGEIHFTKSGQLEWWSNGSGHYEPLASQASQAAEWLRAAGLSDISVDKFIPK